MGFLDLITNRRGVLAAQQQAEPLSQPARPALHVVRATEVMQSEGRRIASLPVVTYEGADLNAELRRPGGAETLNDMQSQMLAAARHAGGLVAFVGTGHGKAWAANLLGSVMPGVQRTLVFAPASTLTNLRRERLRLKTHFYLPDDVQFHSYESMQRATPEGQLDYVEDVMLRHGGTPETTLLVFDEAHALRNMLSARGGRVMRLGLKYPQLRFCMLSGSLTDQSIKECAHLAWLALKGGSPYPSPWQYETADHAARHHASNDLQSWALCVDKDGQAGGADWKALAPLWQWAYPDHLLVNYMGAQRVLLARQALRHRLVTCPGVVMSRATSLPNTALVLHGIDLPLPENIQQALSDVENKGVDPDGNVLPDKMAVWRAVRQLAQGFYYVWDWPTNVLTGKPIRDESWLLARSTWNRHVRNEIKYNGATGYDSALLVYNAVYRRVRALAHSPVHEAWLEFVARSNKDESPGVVHARERAALARWVAAGGSDEQFAACEAWFGQRTRNDELLAAWVGWSAQHKHKKKPPTKAIWLSSFLIDYALNWAAHQRQEGHEPIIWYGYDEVGAELGRRGVPVFGAGTEPPEKRVTCALSIGTHSEGKNLQHNWSRQLVLCPPSSGRKWEQMLARTHREGQKADVVRCWVLQHLREFRQALGSARAAADYIQTTGGDQKLLIASYQDIHLPKVASEKFADGTFDIDEFDDDEKAID